MVERTGFLGEIVDDVFGYRVGGGDIVLVAVEVDQARPLSCGLAVLRQQDLSLGKPGVAGFEEEFFITSPGQKLVLYDAEGTVAAGGTIEVCRRKRC